MAKRIVWKKGKVHDRQMSKGGRQRGRWEYPNGNKKGRRWKKVGR